MLLGDLNFRNIDWCNEIAQPSSSDRFLNCVKGHFWNRIIDTPTRDKYINDIVLVGNCSLVHDSSVGEQFGSSDHKIIRIELHLVRKKVASKERKVFLYSKGQYALFNKAVSDIDWSNCMCSCNTIDQKRYMFKKKYTELVEEYIPSKVLRQGHKSKSPWTKDPKLVKARRERRNALVNYRKVSLYFEEEKYHKVDAVYHKEIIGSTIRYEQKLAN